MYEELRRFYWKLTKLRISDLNPGLFLRNSYVKAKTVLRSKLHQWLVDQELKLDPDYDLEKVSFGFANRRNDGLDDRDVIRRIITAYNKAKATQQGLGECYRESGMEWLWIYRNKLQPIIQALQAGDVEGVRGVYRNFWRDPCSTGLLGLPIDMAQAYFGPRILQKNKSA